MPFPISPHAAGPACGLRVGIVSPAAAKATSQVVVYERAGLPPCEGVTAEVPEPLFALHRSRPAWVRQEREAERLETIFRPGDLSLVPPARSVSCWTRGSVSFVHVQVSRQLLGAAFEDAPTLWAGLGSTALFRLRDDVALHVMERMLDTSRRGEPSRLYLESAAVVLAERFLSRQGSGMPPPRRGLGRRALARVEDFLRENLSLSPGMVELAALVNVSPRHFGRLFKATTGLSPHAFMNELRVERARRLLAEGELSVAAVASEVGFSNPSHFAAFFRRATGHAPRTFRLLARVGRPPA